MLGLLSKKETSSLAGSEGSLAMAVPLMVSVVPSALNKPNSLLKAETQTERKPSDQQSLGWELTDNTRMNIFVNDATNSSCTKHEIQIHGLQASELLQ